MCHKKYKKIFASLITLNKKKPPEIKDKEYGKHKIRNNENRKRKRLIEYGQKDTTI